MSVSSRIEAFHKTIHGLIISAIVELGLAYLFTIFAMNDGSLIDWFLAVVLVIAFVTDLVKLIKRFFDRAKR